MAKKNEVEINVSDYLDLKKVEGEYTPDLMEVIKRKCTADAARNAGIKVTTQQLQKAVDNFRYMNNLNKANETETWMSHNLITPEMLETYIETNILISKFKDRLENKASKTKYASHPMVKETIRNLIYEVWLNENIKP